jgi:hypothetical protein
VGDGSGRLLGVARLLVEADVLEGADREHEVEGAGQVDVDDVDVAHARRLLVLVDDGVRDRLVVRQHVAHLEHPRPGVRAGEGGGGQRDLHGALVEPGPVVGVPQVGVVGSVVPERAGRGPDGADAADGPAGRPRGAVGEYGHHAPGPRVRTDPAGDRRSGHGGGV